MGSGIHGGFGSTKGKSKSNLHVGLPKNQSQLKHIFRDSKGHLKNTVANHKLLVTLANNSKYYVGTDKYGNKWNIKQQKDGKQLWVRYRNGKINEGGRNNSPKPWDNETGLNKNPFKKGRK